MLRSIARGCARPQVILAVLALAILAAPIAGAVGEGRPVSGGARNPSSDASQAYTAETEIIADTTTYGTRQSNKREGDGGGAIYGCRSNLGNEPCLRSNNLATGRAFEFVGGNEGGRIELKNTAGPPLTTNATGIATGFNADKVDGKDAADFAGAGDLLFATVNADASTVTSRPAGATATRNAETFTYTVTFGSDVSKCSFTASPLGDTSSADAGPLTINPGPDAKQVRVDATAATAFHLQVIC